MGLKSTRYDEEFKQSLVALYNNGKIMSDLCKEYGVSKSALSKWIKLYSTVKMDDGDIMTAKQVKELQKKLAQLEEENLILKKPLPYSRHTHRKISSYSCITLSASSKNFMQGIKSQ